jgi:tetratricopeptide (TPR) repeat protein
MGAFRESLEAYTGIASVYLSQDRSEEALQLYTQALEGFQTLGCRYEEARTQLRISSIRLKQDQLESAVDRRRTALEIGKELENVDLIAEASSALAWLHERQAE